MIGSPGDKRPGPTMMVPITEWEQMKKNIRRLMAAAKRGGGISCTLCGSGILDKEDGREHKEICNGRKEKRKGEFESDVEIIKA